MRYTFRNEQGMERHVTTPMKDIAGITEYLESYGYQRVYDVPNVTIVPGYWDAKAESAAIADDPWLGGKRMSHEKMMEV